MAAEGTWTLSSNAGRAGLRKRRGRRGPGDGLRVDRLREVRLPDGRRVTYGYDALGRRVHKWVEGPDGAVVREQRFVWDGNALTPVRELAGRASQPDSASRA
jgi:hypothetical protein